MEKEVLITIKNKTKKVKCDYFKLLRTMYNKKGDKYTEKEMLNMGFEKK